MSSPQVRHMPPKVEKLARVETTLFLLVSVDGKITSGESDALDSGRATSTLVDGRSLQAEEELVDLKALGLLRCEVLERSYLRLEYDVINDTVIDPKV